MLRKARFVGSLTEPVRKKAKIARSISSFRSRLASGIRIRLAKSFELVEIPIAVLELAKCHGRREFATHVIFDEPTRRVNAAHHL